MDCAYNTLTSNKFIFKLDRIPETSFFAIEAELPDISISSSNESWIDNSSNAYVGSAIEYGTLDVRFMVDENLTNWLEIFNWIKSMSYDKRSGLDRAEHHVSNGILITLTNNSNPNLIFEFKDIFPISLGRIGFNTQSTAEPVYCDVTFKYSSYDVQS